MSAPQGQARALERIRRLEAAAPALYSRWSPRAWRLVCEGPAMRLWESIAGTPGAEQALEDYLLLAREAVGLQYLSASKPADLEGGGGGARSFLAEALCDVAPRLLGAVPAAERAGALARLWNAGEKLLARPLWLNRYLAARLRELDRLEALPAFLERVIEEGMEEGPRSAWSGPYDVSVVDPAPADAWFLPGAMHLVTPAVVCVHDRRRDARHVALLLRRRAAGGPLCLGATPCLRPEAPRGTAPGVVAHSLSAEQQADVLRSAKLDDAVELLATRSGLAAIASSLSQRVRVVESAA